MRNTNRHTLSFAAAAAFLAGIAGTVSVAEAFTISGRIVIVGGEPSAGATVWIDMFHTKTDSLGDYTVGGLWNEEYVVKVWAEHCLASVVDTVRISNGDLTGVNDTIVAADIVEDGRINLYDAGELLRYYGATPDSVLWDEALDFDGSGVIDSLDTVVLMRCWKDRNDISPPSFMEVLEPNSATIWPVGQENVPIRWNAGNLAGPVGINLISGHDFIGRITSSTPNSGSYLDYDVPVGLAPGSEYRVAVFHIDSGAYSLSEYFEIRRSVTVTEPTSATIWIAGQKNAPVTWLTGNLGGAVDIGLYRGVDLVQQWPGVLNDGAHSVEVPMNIPQGSDYRILVYWDESHSDSSDYFTIKDTTIVVTEPTSATVWNRGQTNVPITWITGNLGGQVKITLYWGEGAYYQWSNVPNSGAYTVDVPAISVAPGHRILVSWDEAHRDFSDYFAIQDTNRIFISAPDSASVWAVGTRIGPIRWNTASLGLGGVKINLYKGPNMARSITSYAPNNGSYARYDVPLNLPPGRDYRVFVQYGPDGNGGFSDSFEVRQCIIITEPTSATVWNRGQANAAIKWNTGNLGGTVDIELYNGGTPARQWAAVSNNGAYTVAVPIDVLTGSGYRILVRWDASHADSSDYFTIRDTGIAVVNPDVNTAWMSGQQNVAIDWKWTSMTGSVTIGLYRGDILVETIASSTPNDGEYSEYGVPLWLTSGTDYRVRIESDTGDFVFSDYFTIERPSGWVWLYPKTGGYRLNSVCFSDANTGTAVGEYGTILRTTDGGATWVRQWGSTRKSLYGVAFRDANTGFAVGEGNLILKTTDGGATWVSKASRMHHGEFYSVAFADADTVMAVGQASACIAFCRSTDGGETWTCSLIDGYTFPRSVAFYDAKIGAAAADIGVVYWTKDGGATWNRRNGAWTNSYEDGTRATGIAVLDANTWVATGLEFVPLPSGPVYSGAIAVTRDAAVTWQRGNPGLLPNSISFADANTGTVVGEGGTIFRTSDGGATWAKQTSGLGSAFLGVSLADANTGTAVGAYGRIVRTTDGGATWVLQTPSTMATLRSISFTGEDRAVIVGGIDPVAGLLDKSGAILRTTDGGDTWSPQETWGGVLNDVSMANADTGTAIGDYVDCSGCDAGFDPFYHGIILRTTDGGATWATQSSPNMLLSGLWHMDSNRGIVFGTCDSYAANAHKILRTQDGGATWTPEPFAFRINDVWFSDANTGTAIGGGGVILRTSDGGATWAQQTSGTTGYLTAVNFSDANNGTVVGDGGIILRTVDGGATWTRQTSGTTWDLLGVRFVDADTGIAVGIDGMILRTTDGGATWIRQDSGTTKDLYAVYLKDANTAIVAGEGGALLKTTTGGE